MNSLQEIVEDEILYSNLRRTAATVSSNVAQLLSILACLTAPEQEIQLCVELLMKTWPKVVDLSFARLLVCETKPLANKKTTLCLIQTFVKEKIQMVFPNVEAILEPFLCRF